MHRLYDFGPSPFCLKVRAILEHKRLPYQRLDIRGPAYLELLRRSPTGKVPALDVDGRLITDSTEIARFLDETVPDPALVPPDPRDAALNHVFEDWADESLYWYGLYYRWEDRAGRRSAGVAFPRGTATLLSWAVGRGGRKRLAGQGMGKKPPELVAAELEHQLDHLASLYADDWLLGPTPHLCDFAVAAQLVYLSQTPHGGPRVAARPVLSDVLARFKAHREACRGRRRG